MPILFVISLSKKAKLIKKQESTRKSTRKLKVPKIKTDSDPIPMESKEIISNTSESEAAEADDENEKLIQTKTKKAKSLRKSEIKTSPIKRVSKRNSKSQAEN